MPIRFQILFLNFYLGVDKKKLSLLLLVGKTKADIVMEEIKNIYKSIQNK